MGQYLTLSLRGLGFTTFQTNLFVIPSQVFSAFNILLFTKFAGLMQRNAFNEIIGQVWALPFLVCLYVLNTSTENKWIVHAIITLLLSYPSNHSVQVDQHDSSLGWASRNANTVRSRTVSTAMHNMCCQAGSVIYSNIYRKDDAPRYLRGNRDLITVTSSCTFRSITITYGSTTGGIRFGTRGLRKRERTMSRPQRTRAVRELTSDSHTEVLQVLPLHGRKRGLPM